MELKWFTKFTASELPPDESNNISQKDNINKIILNGTLIDDTENKNRWKIEQSDMEQLAKDFVGVGVRLDHQEKVSSVVGKILSTSVDEPHSETKESWDQPNLHPHIHFRAEAIFNDSNVMIPIKMGYVNSVSPAVDSLKILCSECRAPMKYNGYSHVKTCQCEGGTKLLKELSPREMSIVCSPAYQGTTFQTFGFAASVDNSFLSEEQVLSIVEDELTKRG